VLEQEICSTCLRYDISLVIGYCEAHYVLGRDSLVQLHCESLVDLFTMAPIP